MLYLFYFEYVNVEDTIIFPAEFLRFDNGKTTYTLI